MSISITVHWNDGDETIIFDNEDDAKGYIDALSKVGSVPYTWGEEKDEVMELARECISDFLKDGDRK